MVDLRDYHRLQEEDWGSHTHMRSIPKECNVDWGAGTAPAVQSFRIRSFRSCRGLRNLRVLVPVMVQPLSKVSPSLVLTGTTVQATVTGTNFLFTGVTGKRSAKLGYRSGYLRKGKENIPEKRVCPLFYKAHLQLQSCGSQPREVDGEREVE